MADQLYTLHDVGHRLKVSDKTVRRLIAEDADFPRPITVRGQARWIPDDVFAWELVQKVKARLLAEWTSRDTAGQSGTTAPPGDIPASHPKPRK
jgi:predicted DNA-binding transcriptional regulator AlpA